MDWRKHREADLEKKRLAMNAYRLATRSRLHLWSTKRTLKSLKRKGLVEATGTLRLFMVNGRERGSELKFGASPRTEYTRPRAGRHRGNQYDLAK